MTTDARARYDAENPAVSFRIPRASADKIDGARDLYPAPDDGKPSRSSVLRAMVLSALPILTDRALIEALDARRGSASRGAYLATIVRKHLEET